MSQDDDFVRMLRRRIAGVTVVFTALVVILMLILSHQGTVVEPVRPGIIPPSAVLAGGNDMPVGLATGLIEAGQEEVPYGIMVFRYNRLSHGQPYVNVLQRVYSYPEEVLAVQAYSQVAAKYERFDLQGWDEVPIPAFETHANEATIACFGIRIDGWHAYTCSYVARYGTLVVDVGANVFDNRWLTKEQYRDVLIAVDRRAAAALGGTPEDQEQNEPIGPSIQLASITTRLAMPMFVP